MGACFAATESRYLAVIESTTNSSVYQNIPELHVRLSVPEFMLESNWAMVLITAPMYSKMDEKEKNHDVAMAK